MRTLFFSSRLRPSQHFIRLSQRTNLPRLNMSFIQKRPYSGIIISTEKKIEMDNNSAVQYSYKTAGIIAIPPQEIRDAVSRYVDNMNKDEAYKIGVEFFKKGQERIFRSGSFKYDLRGIFDSKQECYLQNHWTVPFFPSQENIEKAGGVDNYFTTDKHTARDFCKFKYMLAAESLLNNINARKLLTDQSVRKKAQERELPESIAENIISYAKNEGYLQPKEAYPQTTKAIVLSTESHSRL
jgi:hypothetical protein